MSIATKNTITNYWKMEDRNSYNLLNKNRYLLNNNNLINNKIKFNNMLNSDSDNYSLLLLKGEQEALVVEKASLLSPTPKTLNNVVNTRKVLVIYTGGTIGMLRSPDSDGLVCIPHMLEKTVRTFPNFHDEAYVQNLSESDLLVLPKTDEKSSRVSYRIMEYDPLLDSSNMTIDDWVTVAKDIKANYEAYDGFVVLHGTDTMAYTASALSFMLENLGKSVIVTGSQIPLFESRSDGKENFLGALIMAGQYILPEVCVYFGHKLFRGNRTTKVSSDRLNAFDSPNLSPLATLGINIEIDYKILRQQSNVPFGLNTALNQNVTLLRLYPSITAQTVRAFLQAPTEGVVLQTYGAGNFPTNRVDLLAELEMASKRGVIIVNCTQCGHGTVAAIYETGVKTESAGVIPGYDMTCEAALAKLSYVLGRDDWTLERKREMMKVSIRGELTSAQKIQLPLAVVLKDIALDIEFDQPEAKVTYSAPKVQNIGPASSSSSALLAAPVPSQAISVLNNGRVVPNLHSQLNFHDFKSLIGQNRSPMWQVAGIIFAGQLLLIFCLAVVL